MRWGNYQPQRQEYVERRIERGRRRRRARLESGMDKPGPDRTGFDSVCLKEIGYVGPTEQSEPTGPNFM